MDLDQIIAGDPVVLGLAERLGGVYDWALGIGALVALGIIVYGGVLYTTSAGNPSRIDDAKKWIWAALGGLALLFGAFLILNVINPNLTTLQEIAVETNPDIEYEGSGVTIPPPPDLCIAEGETCNVGGSGSNGCCVGACVVETAGDTTGICTAVDYEELDSCVAGCVPDSTCNTFDGFYPVASACTSQATDVCKSVTPACQSLPSSDRGTIGCRWDTASGRCVDFGSCTEGYIHPLGEGYCGTLGDADCAAEALLGDVVCEQRCNVSGDCDTADPGTFGCFLKSEVGLGCYIE